MNSDTLCPCISGLEYKNCCAPLHKGEITAHNAEQLMRSRYSAFVLENVDYLISTLHPDKRKPDDEIVLKQTITETDWLGLQIIKHRSQQTTASVEFIAFYQEAKIEQLHEQSNFIKLDKQWFYVDGKFLPATKVSRNQACFCGSGNKFKHCHGRN